MHGLYLTPQALPVLVQPLLTGCLVVYFLRLPEKTRATWVLAAMFTNATLYMTVNFLMYTTIGPSNPYFGSLLQFFALPGMMLVIAFGYAFMGNVHPRESRFFLWGVGTLVVVALGALAVRLVLHGGAATEPGFVYEFLGLGLVLWSLSVFIRKARLPGKAGKAHRALGWLFSLLFVAQLTSILALSGIIDISLHYLVGDLSFLLLFAGFGFVYLNHAQHPTSFQIKLVGLSLFTVLAVLSVISLTVFTEEALLRENGVRVPGQTSLRFEPTTDGYRRVETPFAYDPAPGERLQLEAQGRAAIQLGFAFPFAGEPRHAVSIYQDAVVTFGEKLSGEDALAFSGQPLIAPLRIDLRETKEGGVYLKRARDRLTITWMNLTQPTRSNRNTVQLVLFADGTILFNYDRIEAVIAEGMRGILPTGVLSEPNRAALPLDVQEAGASLVENFVYAYRRGVHGRMMPMALGLFGATVFILLIFPLFFRASLIQPLNRLLGGVRRINEGDLRTMVSVDVRDEVGRLSEHFNQMTRSLQQAHHELREYAEHLEEMVEERTRQVALQNDQLAVQAERLRELDEAKTRFFANVSHELRTPLTLIVGPLERLATAANGTMAPEVREQLGMMLRNGHRLQRLINQILDLTKLEAGSVHLDRRPHDLVAFVRRHVTLYKGLAQYKDVDLAFQAKVPACEAWFDAEQLEKVLANLLSNALKFTGKGGRVSVTVEACAETAAVIVEDTGVGIPAEKIAHVFDRFYQVEDTATRTYEGTGIGLSLVKELVELHEGSVHATSEPGRGSTFTVRIPTAPASELIGDGAWAGPVRMVKEAEDAGGPSPGQETEESTRTRALSAALQARRPAADGSESMDQTTVLVVEDNADMRAFVRSILEPTYRVLEAADGEAGLCLAQSALPDLILADVMMPEMDGLTMSLALREDPTTGSIPIILLTARAALDDRVQGLETGADAYLTKPFSADVLQLQVSNLIARQQRLRERLRREPAGSEPPTPQSAFEAQVRTVIEQHLSDSQFSVAVLADKVALSRQQLYRRLRDDTGETPVAYIRRFRLERAARLLRERQGNVSEVAYAVGFNSLAYFTRCFHDHFGETPSAFLLREVS